MECAIFASRYSPASGRARDRGSLSFAVLCVSSAVSHLTHILTCTCSNTGSNKKRVQTVLEGSGAITTEEMPPAGILFLNMV
jgi:hypothetical protein